eukprot:1158472-Pelagomonas_calceolata.AAC.10
MDMVDGNGPGGGNSQNLSLSHTHTYTHTCRLHLWGALVASQGQQPGRARQHFHRCVPGLHALGSGPPRSA